MSQTDQKTTTVCAIVPILRVPDVVSTVRFYVDKLGFGEEWTWGDPPYYAGASIDGNKLHFIQSKEIPAAGSDASYLMVVGIDAYYDRLQQSGVQIVQPLGLRPYGLRDFAIHDLNGYKVSIGEAAE